MVEWWTYRPSDFVMFSPRLYGRLFEALNAEAWPLALAVAVGGLALLWRRPAGARAGRALLLALALAWGASGWLFQARLYAPINWPAQGFAVGFGLMALTLAASAGAAVAWREPSPRTRAGWALAAWALLGHPWLAGLLGRPWLQAEFTGLAPDPTALATLAGLLLLRVQPRAWAGALWVGTLAWLAISFATLATIGWPQAWVLGGLAVLAVAAAWRTP